MSIKLAPHHRIAMNEYEAACQRFARCAVGDELQRKHARSALKAAETKMKRAFGAMIDERDRIMYDISIKAVHSG